MHLHIAYVTPIKGISLRIHILYALAAFRVTCILFSFIWIRQSKAEKEENSPYEASFNNDGDLIKSFQIFHSHKYIYTFDMTWMLHKISTMSHSPLNFWHFFFYLVLFLHIFHLFLSFLSTCFIAEWTFHCCSSFCSFFFYILRSILFVTTTDKFNCNMSKCCNRLNSKSTIYLFLRSSERMRLSVLKICKFISRVHTPSYFGCSVHKF